MQDEDYFYLCFITQSIEQKKRFIINTLKLGRLVNIIIITMKIKYNKVKTKSNTQPEITECNKLGAVE